MKPPIEYRAPQRTEHQERISKAMVAHHKRRKQSIAAEGAPEPKPGGRWVWVPDGKVVSLRDQGARRDRMREYMRKRRAEKKPTEQKKP